MTQYSTQQEFMSSYAIIYVLGSKLGKTYTDDPC